MIKRQRLLIATTNEGKYKEIVHFLGDLPFELVSLKDLGQSIPAPEEIEETMEGNALLKAKYYAEKTGLLTLADDGGLFIDALDGWPGVASARIAATKAERIKLVIERLKDVKKSKRRARFKAVLTIYDSKESTFFSSYGELSGRILEKPHDNGDTTWGYNSIFFVEEIQKTYGELSIQDKNSISHRGKALIKIKHYLQNQFGPKHIPVPVGLIIKDGKLLVSLRNDPHRPEFHKKWEFPGGVIEFGEEVTENLQREIKEETGYNIEVIKQLQYIKVKWQKDLNYQVYLIPFVCRITDGKEQLSDAEILEIRYVPLDALLQFDLIGDNKQLYQTILSELKQVVADYHL